MSHSHKPTKTVSIDKHGKFYSYRQLYDSKVNEYADRGGNRVIIKKRYQKHKFTNTSPKDPDTGKRVGEMYWCSQCDMISTNRETREPCMKLEVVRKVQQEEGEEKEGEGEVYDGRRRG